MNLTQAIHDYIDCLIITGPHNPNAHQWLEVPLRYLKARQGDKADLAYPEVFAKLFTIWGFDTIRSIFDELDVVDRPLRMISEENFKIMMQSLDSNLVAIRLMDGQSDHNMVLRETYATLKTIFQLDEYVCNSPVEASALTRATFTLRDRIYRENRLDFSPAR